MSLGGIVLCGGLSTRMGRPKALLPWRGKLMVQHVIGVLREVVDDVVVVTSEELALPPVDARIVRDREPRLGPLGGIREGLEASRADLCYVTSTDAPFLSADFVRRVLSYGTAAAPEVDGFVQSLAAAYPRALAGTASELIAAGRMRPLFLLESGQFRRIAPSDLPGLDALRNLNTPEEYLSTLSADARATVEFLGTTRARAGRAALDVPCGRLGDVLGQVERETPLRIDGHHLVSINGMQFVRAGNVPVGPGDRVIVTDAAAGG